MASRPATETGSADADLQLWAARSVLRRSQWVGILLIVNWVLLGWVMYRVGIRSLVGALAFGFGLLALIGGMSQLRAVRRARAEPLIRIRDGELSFHAFTGPIVGTVPLEQIAGVVETDRTTLRLRRRDGEEVEVPWLALSEDDRAQLEAVVRGQG